MKRALITGIMGQDGSYLAELLLQKGYQVTGLVLRGGAEPSANVAGFRERLRFAAGDLSDQASLDAAVSAVRPDEVYNFAAQSAVPLSWAEPVMTGDVTGLGAARLLESVRRHAPEARVFQASSAAIFGSPASAPQNELTPIRPISPYGAAKAYAHFIATNYRQTHGLHACNGILFNHESPRRGPDFVTRKVTLAAARIKAGLQHELRLGDLDAVRDWGFAGDYVHAVWLMLQQSRPDDYVIASGEARTVRELVAAAFAAAGLQWERYVVRDERFVRPEGPVPLVGDPSRARQRLEWTARVGFSQMIEDMVRQDMNALEAERQPA